MTADPATPFADGAARANAGIPSKAFYETAMALGTPEAAKIWVKSLPNFPFEVTIPIAARVILQTAKDAHGDHSKEFLAVKKAWETVGIKFD
ncbi:M4 family metallopeptidase [Mesorhizobium sp. M0767]|uniref:M4 family metallopeptidase n=1 Tax=unclassified Mesorhizobium TaxID=325217 RepID=UPI0033356113